MSNRDDEPNPAQPAPVPVPFAVPESPSTTARLHARYAQISVTEALRVFQGIQSGTNWRVPR